MWPTTAFCVVPDAWEFSNNQYLSYSPVFESAQLANKQDPLKQT